MRDGADSVKHYELDAEAFPEERIQATDKKDQTEGPGNFDHFAH